MITFLKGNVFKNSLSNPSFVEVETNSGIGYKVVVHQRFDFKKKGEEIFLFTSYQVREDSQTLYGFDNEEERILFEKLIAVSGIGPKIGMAVLLEYSSDQLRKIILKSDASALSEVSGLGKKGAQKIILELVGKVNLEEDIKIENEIVSDVKGALQSLGYKGAALKDAMKKANDICKDESLGLEEVLKLVFKR